MPARRRAPEGCKQSGPVSSATAKKRGPRLGSSRKNQQYFLRLWRLPPKLKLYKRASCDVTCEYWRILSSIVTRVKS
jgi:hypothetical protein